MKLTGKYIRFGRNHIHVYIYSHIRREWVCVGCRMDIPGMECSDRGEPIPRGYKHFDGSVVLNEYEALKARI